MQNSFVINSYSDFINYAVGILNDEFAITNVVVSDNLNFRLKVYGYGWDGLVDYRIGTLVVRLQEDFFAFYNSVTGQSVDFRSSINYIQDISIKVKVEPGCSDITFNINKALEAIISKMSGKQVIASFLIAAAIFGSVWSWDSYLDNQVKIAEIHERMSREIKSEETKQIAIKTLIDVSEVVTSNQRARKYLADNLGEKDKLEIPQTGKVFTRAEARNNVSSDKQPKRPIAICADDLFSIEKLDFTDSSIQIALGRINFPASLKALGENSKKRLRKIFDDALAADIVPQVNLQVTVQIDKGKVVDAYVNGIGGKREEAVDLLASLKISNEEIRNSIPLPLFDRPIN